MADNRGMPHCRWNRDHTKALCPHCPGGKLGDVLTEPHPLSGQPIVVLELPRGFVQRKDGIWVRSKAARARIGEMPVNLHLVRDPDRYRSGQPAQRFRYDLAPPPIIARSARDVAAWLAWALREMGLWGVAGEPYQTDATVEAPRPQTAMPCYVECPDCRSVAYVSYPS
ncbi:hypothetical protein NET02_12660 [Thermomicrobiaceae bacterium CFH 74404]|uniref:Uncharacterized protein n=1 Tax=Thermalbibacter longus TaxID=2951981 RepID=A0AA42BAM1_9BACT|nr:hypothetical protein [Thermalbibacter longus]MCM8750001.1 hypothetical protein [Thermalbibacter longus]